MAKHRAFVVTTFTLEVIFIITVDTALECTVPIKAVPGYNDISIICNEHIKAGCMLTYRYLITDGCWYEVYDKGNECINSASMPGVYGDGICGGGFTVDSRMSRIRFSANTSLFSTFTLTVQDLISDVSSITELCSRMNDYCIDDALHQDVINLYLAINDSPSPPDAGDRSAPCTELARYKETIAGGTIHKTIVSVVAHGLTAGKTYAIHLYTSARRRGGRQDPWLHPSNENTGDGYTGKGYANLVQAYRDQDKPYPAVPDWMPRGGILQTEWEFTAAAETEKVDIDLGTWLLPLLKPRKADFDLDEYGLIGVSNKSISPLLFKFCVVKDGAIGECRNTLRVGLRARTDSASQRRFLPFITDVATKETPLIESKYLYTSIN